jgi:hypothetical protein|tara:strand:- start:12 stop:1382 length:1371 start_codon:yes stop_codon:yes gene_type:complete
MQQSLMKHRNEFKKGTRLRTINEDPTYLSWMIMFDKQSASSPLFNGTAEKYLIETVGGKYGEDLAKNLTAFKNLLFKINVEMPWFWNTISGLDQSMMYKNLVEPYWGAEDPKLEIECLEETVDLTVISLMDLYKRSVYDFNRWIEIIPHNLRYFSMQIYVSEIRQFQQDTHARDLNGSYKPSGPAHNEQQEAKPIHEQFNLTAMPFVTLQFDFCEFDIDAIAPMFADLGKNPELRKPKIAIKWKTVIQAGQKYPTEVDAKEGLGVIGNPNPYDFGPFDPLQSVKDAATDKLKSIKDGVMGKIDNFKGAFSQDPNGIANVYGHSRTGLSGPLASIADNAIDNLTASLLLGNVHGANTLSNIQDAITAGSVNAIANLAGQLFNKKSSEVPGNMSPTQVYDKPSNFVLDSSPDGNISPKQVYDRRAPDRDDPINDNIYGGRDTGVDSTPDGNLNDNVHE